MTAPEGGLPPSWVRDHLANERTLLAWVRTALSFMAFGVAVAKLGVLVHLAGFDHPELRDELPSPAVSAGVGITLIAFGGALSVAGLIKSRRWGHQIHPGLAPPSQRTLVVVAVLTLLVAVGLIVYVALS